MNAIEQFKKYRNIPIFRGGGKPYYFVKGESLYRKNTDGTETYVPFIKGSTYNEYKSSQEFIDTLESAFKWYGERIKNERELLIKLSGRTKPIRVGDDTYNMPIEVFDRIVAASKAAGINPKLGLAIAIKESSGYTNPKRINTYYGGLVSPKNWNPISAKNYAGPSTVVSNWQYFTNSPYASLLSGWESKVGEWDVDRLEEDAKYLKKRYKDVYDNYDKNIEEDILVNMFRLPLNKINSGEKGYANTIRSYMNDMSW